MNLEDEKYHNLTARIRSLRAFGRDYLSYTSILSILPTGITTKDFDLIVEVTRRSEDGYRLSNGKEEFVLNSIIPSFASEGSIAKLRSVARIDNSDKSKVIVPNNFTSLINIPSWSHDSQTFRKNYTAMDVEDDSIYTSLAQLQSMSLSKSFLTKMNVKTRNILSKSKLQEFLLLISTKLLSSMMRKRMFLVMLRGKILFQFTSLILFVLTKV